MAHQVKTVELKTATTKPISRVATALGVWATGLLTSDLEAYAVVTDWPGPQSFFSLSLMLIVFSTRA